MSERVLYTNCPLCDCSDLSHYRTDDCSKHPLYQPFLSPQLHWKRCRRCLHIFSEGYFTDDIREKLFRRTLDQQKVGFDIEGQRAVSARIVEKVLPFVRSGNWLDVGFGNGSLLFTAQEFGFTPIGIDLRQENVNTLSALGIQAHCQDVGDVSLSEKCSVVSMADVLEHMPYPKKGLKAAHNLLSKGGVLFISMPNTENALWNFLTHNQANPYWGEFEHYHNFSRTRLYALLRESGFEPVRYGISERYRVCMEVISRCQ